MIGIQPSPSSTILRLLRGVSVPEKRIGMPPDWAGLGSHQMSVKETVGDS